MKSRLALALPLFAILIACHACELSGGEIKVMDDFSKQALQYLKDFQRLKPGMTRGEIEKLFPQDGGLQGVSPVRYVHPSCPCLKIDVEFDFERNPDDQNRAIRGEGDRSKKFSKPYLEAPCVD